VKDKTIEWYYHNAGQHQLGFSICCAPHQLLMYCGLLKICSGANLAPESLRTVCVSGTLQGAQVTVANCPVINMVDCCEEFYSFTNQTFVFWHLGACQEWWRLLVQFTRSTGWCADTMFCYCFFDKQPWLLHGITLSTLLLTMTEKSRTDAFVANTVAKAQASSQAI
jgi:hypothetical protein